MDDGDHGKAIEYEREMIGYAEGILKTDILHGRVRVMVGLTCGEGIYS